MSVLIRADEDRDEFDYNIPTRSVRERDGLRVSCFTPQASAHVSESAAVALGEDFVPQHVLERCHTAYLLYWPHSILVTGDTTIGNETADCILGITRARK